MITSDCTVLDETLHSYDEPKQEGGTNTLADAEPTVESTMHPFEPEAAGQKQEHAEEPKQEGGTNTLADAEPTVESTMHLFEPQVAGQEQEHAEEREDNAQLDHPEELGDASLDTITPDDYARADTMDKLQPEKQDEHRESLLDSIPNFITHSMENDHPDTAEDQSAHGHDEIKAPHWTEYADPHANPFVAFCKFFARGRCKNGALCTYRHALTVQEFFLLFRLEPLVWSSQIPVPEEDIQELALVQPLLQSPLQPPPQPLPQPPPQLPPQSSSSLGACAFYPLGKCRNGHKCPFDHIEFPDAGE